MVAAAHLAADATPIEKYVFKPLEGSSHYWSLNYLKDSAVGKSVLDIGAGGGGMGKSLREAGANQLVAVEIDAHARSRIKSIYDELYESISPLQGRTFDIILLLDVLEHMAEPFEFMREVEQLLAPGGVAVISVPNIAHWSVRFGLLFGRFEYASRGILDRTHLQFFNRSRFLQLLSQQRSCVIAATSASIEPVELIIPMWASDNLVFKALSRFRVRVARMLPGLMAYQLLGALRKR